MLNIIYKVSMEFSNLLLKSVFTPVFSKQFFLIIILFSFYLMILVNSKDLYVYLQ